MVVQGVKFAPGQQAEFTASLNQAGWSRTQLVRWRKGLPEKLGGWVKFWPASFGSAIRDLHAWQGLNFDRHLAVAAEGSLSVITGTDTKTVTNITPQITISNPFPDFSTINTQNIVTIIDPNFGPTLYSTLFLATPIAVGGLVLSGSYQIATVVGAHSYTILAASNATATVNNAGAVPVFSSTIGNVAVNVLLPNHGFIVGSTFYVYVQTLVGGLTIVGTYLVQDVVDPNNFTINASVIASSTASQAENNGLAQFIYYVGIGPVAQGAGWGVGPYGLGGYGMGVAQPAAAGTPITTTDWTTENWGEILLACPFGGTIYQWSPDSGFFVATPVFGAPLINGGIFVAMPARILVAWGSSIDGVQDPLLIRWTDSENFNDWVDSSQNQAGSYRIPSGSAIMGGLQSPNYALIWTDLAVWAMQYVDSEFVFGFDMLADKCGAVSSHAMAASGSSVFWMSSFQFYELGANGVKPLDCDVWDVIFQDIDADNIAKVRCAVNSGFDEVTWFYPSASSGNGEIDSYVKLNTANPAKYLWDTGKLARSAWVDQNVYGPPIGADPLGYVYQHEVGHDADGVPMVPMIESGQFTLNDGDSFMFVDWMLPDFKYEPYEFTNPAGPGFSTGDPWSSGFSSGFGGGVSASIQVSLYVADYPNDVPVLDGPYTVTRSIKAVNPRSRGRLCSLRITSSDAGSFWRLGDLRYRASIDGKN